MKLTLRTCCLVLITLLLASYAGMGLGVLPGIPFQWPSTPFGGATWVQQSAKPGDGSAKLNQGSSTEQGATWAPPPPPLTVGSDYGGGKIGYILQPGDPGYDATKIKGLIVGPTDYTGKPWAIGYYQTHYTNVSSWAIGTGASNTTALVNLMGPGNYFAYTFDTLTLGGYTDWYLPSANEMEKLIRRYDVLGMGYDVGTQFAYTQQYLNSTEDQTSLEFPLDGTDVNPWQITDSSGFGCMGSVPKSATTYYARPVRSFVAEPCIATTSSTAVAACNSYSWNGQTYTSSGTYTWTGTNADGCDSTATLKLDIVNNNDSLVVGANMFGGKIGYILQAGDPGYDATKIKGLVVGAADVKYKQWAIGTYESNWTNVTGRSLGSGAANTAALVSLMGPGNYYAYAFDTLSMGGYTDWYLPSSGELSKILPNYQSLGIAFHTFMFYTGTFGYISSTDQVDPTNQNASSIALFSFRTTGLDSMGSMAKNTIMSGVARPVRSFEITPCVPPCSPTTSSIAVAACRSYTWNGQTYTSSGTYTWTGTNAGGCDSTATLKLDIVTNNDSLVVGATMFGGKIGYILQAGDPGYDATKIKGLVVGTSDLTGQQWELAATGQTNVITKDLGAGASNTATLVGLNGPGNYYAYTCDTLTLGGYTDWYLPSQFELYYILSNYQALGIYYGVNGTNNYWPSNENPTLDQSIDNDYFYYFDGNFTNLSGSKTSTSINARPVRSFEVTVCNPEPPASPTALTVIPTSTGGVVNFTAPANDGGAAITNYEYSIDNGANWITPSPAVTSGSLTISGLNNCTEYQVKVRAVNSAGAGTETAAVTLSTRESKLPGMEWTPLSSAPSTNYWSGLAYGNGLFVAVPYGGMGRNVMTSTDGTNWTTRASAADLDWGSVTYGNGLFVAVGTSGTASSRVMTSPDGINWTSRVSPGNSRWVGVTYGNGMFVAVSYSGLPGTAGRVMTSPDGINWTARSAASASSWYSVTYGNGLFVAVAYTGATSRIMTSPDGITWTLQTTPASNSWNSVTYGNGLFVAVASTGAGNRVMTSPDGINWTTQSTTDAVDWYRVAYGNGLFVAATVDGSGKVMTSPDGINWTSKVVDNNNTYWEGLAFGNNKFVAVASGGTPAMVSTFQLSADAPVIDSINVVCDSLSVSFSQTLPALASKVTRYEYSVDNGANWTAKSAADTTSPLIISGLAKGYPYQVKLRAVNSGGTSCESAMVNFCLPASSSDTVNVCNSYSWNGQTYFESGDYSWSGTSASGCDSIANLHLVIKTTPIETNFSDRTVIGIDGGVYVKLNSLVDGGSPITDYEYSLDGGENWLPFIPFTDGSFKINGLINCSDYGIKTKFGNACGSVTPRVIRVTPRAANEPGVNWVNNSIPVKNKWVAITYGNNMYVAVSNDGTGNRVMSSPDGINWTSQTSAADNNWACIAFGNGRFVALSSDGIGNNAMYSLDGITWTSANVAANYQWRSITYGNGLFVAVAEAGAGFGGRVMTSPDGINWISRLSSDDANNWSAITYGNGLFVAVSYDGNGDRVMTSPDGINWTARKAAAPGYWYAITYGNGVFVAISPFGTGNDIMTSPDGINWTLQSNEPNMTLATISYGAGLFVAANFNGTGNDFLTSPDGINWTRSTSESYGLASITYGDGRFVGLTNEGSVLTSTFSLSADAPVIDSISVATNSLSISFSQTLPALAPAVSSYEYSIDNGANWTAKSAADTTSPLIISGLAKGYPYQVKLRAVNSGGTSCESAMVNFCLPASSSDTVDVCGSYSWNGQTYTTSGVYVDTLVSAGGCDSIATLHLTIRQNPVKPTNLVATPINEGAMIQFTAPAGSSSYTLYEYSTDNGANWVMPDPGVTKTPVIISGLTNCTNYLVKIRAVTSCGNSDASSSVAVTPRTTNVPGIDWTMSPYQANPSYSEFYKIVYGNGIYVATSTDYTNNPVVTSTDGINWTTASPGTNLGLYAIVFDGNRFVGLTSENAGNKIAISQDGINWTVSDLNVTFKASSITYGNGMYVAVSNLGYGDRIMSSPDALNWTIRTSPTTNYFPSVTWGNGLFVALSNTGTNRIITSPDGINWTAQVAPTTSSFWKVIYGNGIFMASSSNGGTNSIMTSPDGINWSLQTTPRNATSIAYGNNLFVAVGNSGSGNRVMTSPDGITWTQGKSAGDYFWTDVVYGDGKFVALSLFGPNVSMVSTFSPAADAPVIDSVSINLDTALVYFSQTKPDLATAVTNYEYSIDNGTNWTAQSPAVAISPLALTGFTPGVTYPVKIRAINSAGASCESNAVSVNICQPTSSVDSVTACDNYVWHDSTYTASTNSATWVTTNARGCDSTITLVLTITPKLKWYKDNDADGFGSPTDSTFACTQPIGYVSNNTDCNDGDNKTNPNKYWYKDKDGDGHGSKKPEDRKQSCKKPDRDRDILPTPGDYVDNDLDCNDDDSSINANTVWYKDLDNDGYSNGDTLIICEQPVGYKQLKNLIASIGDCNDNNPTIYPGSGAPSGITSSDKDSIICKGEYVSLTANGVFPNNLILRWYKGGCGLGTSIGTGKYIKVAPTATTTYYVRVFGGPCGVSNCTSITITVKTVPGTLGAITGQSTGVCKAVGVPYTVGSVANAESYVWSVYNQAAVVSGQGTNAITVNFGTPSVFRSDSYNSEASSVIVVKAVNSCGSNSRSLAIDTKSKLTGSISGPASLKKATTGVYSITPAYGAKTYKWTVSTGWSIVSGNGTTTVTVKAGSSTGTLKVAASNDCGDGTAISKSINATSSNEVVETGLALDPSLANQLRVWPVPASQVIHLDAGSLAVKQVQLLDAFGRTLITGEYLKTLDVSKYPSGNYLVRVVTDKGVEVRKVNVIR